MNTSYKYGIIPGTGVNRESMKRRNPVSRHKDKVQKVMHEYKEGSLRSGSKSGPKVTNRKQAIAIAMSEQRRKKKY